MKEHITELEKELAIQKKVSIKLAIKSKENKNRIKKEKINSEININLSNNKENQIKDKNNMIKTFMNKNIFSNNVIREYSNKNNYYPKNCKTSRNYDNIDLPFQLSSDGYYTTKNTQINFGCVKYNKIIQRKNEEIVKQLN